MKCPKCKHVQENITECESCGIVFGVFYKQLLKRKFNEAFEKFNNKEYEAALVIFNAIINIKVPKDAILIERCHHFVLKINNHVSGVDLLENIRNQAEPPPEIYKKSKNVRKSKVFKYIIFSILIVVIVSSIFIFVKDDPNDERYKYSGSYIDVLKAAENGNAKAMYVLGRMYINGDGVKYDLTKAVEWLSKAAEKGNPAAQAAVGYLHDTGKGVNKDKNVAIEWYTKAAKQGLATAQATLADAYYAGNGVKKDLTIASEWYSKAIKNLQKMVKNGDTNAKYHLGYMYYFGNGTEKNLERALSLFTEAADEGDSESQYNLGVMYYNGEGVENDFVNAANYFTVAAKNGHVNAQLKIGLMYMDGKGIAKDINKAIEWYTKAGENGQINAQMILGLRYHEGTSGFPIDLDKSYYWFSKAAAQDNQEAKKFLKNFYDNTFNSGYKSPQEKENYCERDCSVNNHQYDKSCYRACMNH